MLSDNAKKLIQDRIDALTAQIDVLKVDLAINEEHKPKRRYKRKIKRIVASRKTKASNKTHHRPWSKLRKERFAAKKALRMGQVTADELTASER